MAETDNQVVRSKRDTFKERLSSKYPDKQFEDDEELFGQISDDYDTYDDELNGYKERESKLSDMFTSDPRSAHFLSNWRDGEDPVIGLVRQFGTDIKEALDDPDRQEEIAEANKEFVERVAKEKELEEKYQANLQESLANLEQYQADHGLSDEDIDNAMEFIIGVIGDGVMGKFTPETIDMAMKAINHDTDVEEANIEGEVRGKNAKIEEKLRKRGKGDGTVALDGKNSMTDEGNRPRSIFDVARDAQ